MEDETTYSETTLDYDCPFQRGWWGAGPSIPGEPDQPVLFLLIGGETHTAPPGSERYNQALWYHEHPECGFVIEDAS